RCRCGACVMCPWGREGVLEAPFDVAEDCPESRMMLHRAVELLGKVHGQVSVDHEGNVIGDCRQTLVIVGTEIGHPTILADAGAPADAVGPLQGRVMNAAKGGDARPVADLQGVQAGYVGWR